MLQTSINTSLQTTFCLLILLLFTVGCDERQLDVDVSHIEIDVRIERWDSAWFAMTPVSFRQLDQQWRAEHAQFYKHYVEDILALGSIDDSNLFNQIRRFANDPTMAEVHETVQQSFSDSKPLEVELTEAWKHFSYYFPNKNIPSHIAIESGFNAPLALTPNTVGIPLEMYLGGNTPYYDYLQVPMYLRAKMDVDHLAPTILKSWMETEFLLQAESPTLLDEIVHGGKMLYCLEAFFPEMHDSLKLNYSGEKVTWAKEHERNVWAHFIDQDILFSTDVSTIAKFTREGPFTVDLVKESPDRMGYYVGWQIVRAYMAEQETVDLDALMLESDTKKILNISKYKPS
jgi:hypothetical protein